MRVRRNQFSRKKAAQRAKRMAGQGLGPLAFKPDGSMPSVPGAGRDPRNPPRAPASDRDAPSYARRHSPSYEPEASHRR